MRSVPINRYVIFATIAVVGCAADLWTKNWVFDWLGQPGQQQPHWLIDGMVGLQTSLNKGALFGFGQGQVWLFASLSFVAGLAILYWLFVAGAAGDAVLTVALAAIMAGILGNLYDRLGLWSMPGIAPEDTRAVRDWILLQFRDRGWPNFNIADSLLVCGVVTLFWHALRQPSRGKVSTTESAS